MKSIQLGPLEVDPIGYAIHGNAILGIKESGKSYAGTMFGERLMEASIPFTTIDPIGVWHNMRYPGRGKGYPVVVAGSREAVAAGRADIHLTVASAAEIARAAMRNRISLVLDLFALEYSKADWRRIVRSSVEVLLHENAQHGLRHVFLEEAAEFVPQVVSDGDTFAAVEKLARMGGNSRLGYTLISPRSQEISKAVLDLCENVFLFRQRGKNALMSLDKWLSVTGQEDQKAIIASLPDLPQGECWVWLGGDNPHPPVRVKMPAKNSFHPNRRAMTGEEGAAPAAGPVDVGKFVTQLRTGLEKFHAEAEADDPVKLKARIRELEATIKKPAAKVVEKSTAPDPASVARIEQRAYRKGYLAGHAIGGIRGADEAKRKVLDFAGAFTIDKIKVKAPTEEEIFMAEPQWTEAQVAAIRAQEKPASPPTAADAPAIKKWASGAAKEVHARAAAGQIEGVTVPQATILRALAWWKHMGFDEPLRPQIAAICNWKANSSHLKNRLSELSTKGMVTYPSQGRVSMTAEGEAAAPVPDTSVDLLDGVRAVLTAPQLAIFEVLVPHGSGTIQRYAIAEALGWEPGSSHLKNRLSELSTLQIVTYPGKGEVALSPWLFP